MASENEQPKVLWHENISSGFLPNSDVSSSSSSADSDHQYLSLLKSYAKDVSDLDEKVNTIEEELKKTKGFHKSLIRLSNASTIAIIILLLLPALELIGILGIVYAFALEDKLPSWLNIILLGIGVVSIFQLIITVPKIKRMEERITNLENKE